jgi:indolepyruvate ferredoxin oxidoreductase beta subunit
MKKSFDILIAGIGGQGTILASNILGRACLIEGRSIRGTETHGMAQRGGSVESHIRIDGTFGPLIAPATADLLIAFDLLEALRYLHYLKPIGKVVVNRQLVVPTSVYMQKLPVPTASGILEVLVTRNPCVIDAETIAREAGSPLTQNIAMLGAASHFIPLKRESLLSATEGLVPRKMIAINQKAFTLGAEAGEICVSRPSQS